MGGLKRTARVLVVLLVASVLFGFSVLSCSSLSKEDLREELLALDKNRPLAALGLTNERLSVAFDGAEPRTAEFVYAHVPARSEEGRRRPPLVLVHGTPGSLFGWSEAAFGVSPIAGGGTGGAAVRGLAEDRDVWLLDVVGHGITSKVDGTMSFQRGADWVAAFLEGKGLRDATVVGHSYGGEFVWRAAVDHPELVGRVVLVDSSGVPRRDDEWLSEEVAMREMALAPYGYVLNSRKRVEPALQLHFHEPLDESRVTEMTRVLDNSSNWRACVELARDENGTRVEDLRRLAAPTLLLWGADDHAYPPARFAVEFERRLLRPTLVTLPGLGHYPHEEDPAAFNAALSAWLDSVEPALERESR